MCRARLHRRDGVGHGAAGVVLAVDAQPEPGAVLDLRDGLGDAERQHPAVGVAEHGDVRACGDGRVEHPQRGVGVEAEAVEEVLGVEEDPPAFVRQEGHRVGDHGAVLGDVGAQGALDVAAVGLRDERDDRSLRVEQGADLRVGRGGGPGLAGGAERDERGVPQLQLPRRGAGEELGVLGHRPRPATLDVADPQRVEVAGDGELVGHRVADPLPLGTVAQRRVVDVEVVAEGGAGRDGAGGHRGSWWWDARDRATKKTPRGCERSARRLGRASRRACR